MSRKRTEHGESKHLERMIEAGAHRERDEVLPLIGDELAFLTGEELTEQSGLDAAPIRVVRRDSRVPKSRR
jgi:hypothetical protein